jgi:hypothetical protein
VLERINTSVCGYPTTGRIVGVACNLETCLVRLFDRYHEQFLVEWNIRRVLRAGTFIPAC